MTTGGEANALPYAALPRPNIASNKTARTEGRARRVVGLPRDEKDDPLERPEAAWRLPFFCPNEFIVFLINYIFD
ncbi:hypothetical protein [Paraburkholderia caballeronis]|uniref:hypothetical protein n=1 Tax=Paraburkholderia caballeronis TaxID=416943 RepID=UPI001FB9D7DD|nr:hypothetical protein [Paraburkholderia caballeronis]